MKTKNVGDKKIKTLEIQCFYFLFFNKIKQPKTYTVTSESSLWASSSSCCSLAFSFARICIFSLFSDRVRLQFAIFSWKASTRSFFCSNKARNSVFSISSGWSSSIRSSLFSICVFSRMRSLATWRKNKPK